MFDIGWSELALIAVVALVVIGPKDLPRALKTVGIYVRKARGMAREFQNTVDDMIREADLDDVKKQVQAISSLDVKSAITKAIDPDGEVRAALEPPAMPSLNSSTPDTPALETPALETPGLDSPVPGPATEPEIPSTPDIPPAPEIPPQPDVPQPDVPTKPDLLPEPEITPHPDLPETGIPPEPEGVPVTVPALPPSAAATSVDDHDAPDPAVVEAAFAGLDHPPAKPDEKPASVKTIDPITHPPAP